MYGNNNRKLFTNINLTPLLDAIFILFIFFIIISNFKKKEVVKVNIPNSINKKAKFEFSKTSSNQIDIKIDGESNILINEKFVKQSEFERKILSLYKIGNRVYIKTDKSANVQTFLNVIERLKKNRIENIKIFMIPEKKQ